jgi:hypothetical protein
MTPQEWQPIDTAPHDATVLAWGEVFWTESGYKVSDLIGPMIVYWAGEGQGPWRLVHGGRGHAKPAHWLPLPTAPGLGCRYIAEHVRNPPESQ